MEFYQLTNEQIQYAFDFIHKFKFYKYEDFYQNEKIEFIVHIRAEIKEFLKTFPDEIQAKMYDNGDHISYKDKENKSRTPKYDGGESAFIIDVNAKANEYLNYLDKLGQEKIEKSRPKEFPLFGKWNDLDNPKYFILKKGCLGCLAEYFQYINNSHYPDDMDIYRKLHTLLYKKIDSPYSLTSFKTAKDRHNETRKNKCFKRGFDKESCLEFLNYFITFKLN